MRRKAFGFIVALALGILAAPLAADAQQAGKVYRVGVLTLSTAAGDAPDVERLGQLGYVDGQNLHMETRFADGERDRLPGLAADLVRLNMHVIMTITPPAAQAAKAATATIPIVMAGIADPVALGLVASLAHPEMVHPGLYPQPIACGGMGKPVNTGRG